jgi:Trk K+ transport system NAD-binding subunit
MLATVGFTALFTAGLVDRMLEPRLVSLIGARSAPRRVHVLVVGMGQVGIRLCTELRRRGVPVVGVERDRNAAQLHVARALKIPVVVEHGADRAVLERLGLRRAVALAAVGSDEYDNIAVAIAANAVSAGTRVVLRAGEQEAIAETRSLLPLGVTRDVLGLAARSIADELRAVADADATQAQRSAASPTARPACPHD